MEKSDSGKEQALPDRIRDFVRLQCGEDEVFDLESFVFVL
jgi:hypothetical protein